MFDPERAILIKGGDALGRRDKLLAAALRRHADKIQDGLFGWPVIPGRKRILCQSGIAAGDEKRQQKDRIADWFHGLCAD